MIGAEQLLTSEKFVIDELEVMQHQLSQYLVISTLMCVGFYRVMLCIVQTLLPNIFVSLMECPSFLINCFRCSISMGDR